MWGVAGVFEWAWLQVDCVDTPRYMMMALSTVAQCIFMMMQ